jgi:peptidyl-prolyl cis-trans isomerase B (cyclophilin B)
VKLQPLAALAAIIIASPARAQDAPLTPPALALSAALDAEQVPVGGTIGITVTLRNTSNGPIEVLGGDQDGKLAEDRAIVSFDVQIDDGRTFHVTRIHPSADEPRSDWPTKQLEAGKTMELKVALPALTRGAWRIIAGYRRGTPQALAAQPVVANVVPGEGGATDVEVVMTTTHGPIRIRLFPKDALGTALNFARLITQGATAYGHTRPHFFDGLTFHRVIPGFMVQGGCPLGSGMGDPGYTIPAEFAQEPIKENLKNMPGRLAMARTNRPDSAGSQFFIDVGTPSHLDGQYTVFGEVTRGLDVVYSIASVPTKAPDDQPGSDERSRPIETVRIINARLGLAPVAPAPAVETPR